MGRVKAVLAVSVALAVSLSSAAPARVTAQDAASSVRPLLDSMLIAANAHDTERFMRYYARTPDLVFVFNGRVIQGFDSLYAQQLIWWNHGRSDVVYRYEGDPVFTTLGNDSGSVVVTTRMTATRAGAAGTAVTGGVAVMMVWRRRPEGWRIVAGHESTARP